MAVARSVRRLWVAHLVLAAGVIGVYCLVPERFGPWMFDALSLSAGGVMMAVIKRRRFARPLPWLLIAAAQLSFGVGDLSYDYLSLVAHRSAFPSVADVAYCAGYVLLAAGLLSLIR